ncbi:D-Ala-D-Ala carboxypeptidase family metallohydrolase [Kineosporia succinea]|uniref:Peptidase M15A C-terminal domain-containing protein n=1 Tax=Kineosporia succinea TaxID=84632 RepID=A0ABT9NVL7_9ACTN|nr:D-Ala-D-Ala carboxypeptidase family metallohydrolase [Kineosporia succinea]MDP9824470.1 hypothetical protein [Kineosporia succinea]
MTPDDSTTTDDKPRLIHTDVPDSIDGLDSAVPGVPTARTAPAAPTDEPGRAPVSDDDPDANDRNPFSPRSDVSGDAIGLELGLPADQPVDKGTQAGDDLYLPLSTERAAAIAAQPALVPPPVASAGISPAAAPRPASASLSSTELTRRLRAIGFRIRSTGEQEQAVRAFKTGWFKLGPSLMDGSVANSIMGPRASQAIDKAYQRHLDGLTTMSPHFSFSDTSCRCGGTFTDCRRIWPTRQSVIAAEQLRAEFFPAGLTVSTWCRCTGHNHAVGAAVSSRHLKGDAIDIPATVSPDKIEGLELYTGIGVNRANGNVRHLDLRHGHPLVPTAWYYA